MRSRLTLALAAVSILAALAPGSAAGATEFGDPCVGDAAAPGDYTLTTLAAPPDVRFTAPVSGVITKVKVQVEPFPTTVPTSIKVLRAGGNGLTVTGETTVSVGSGTTTADTRLPVQVGDRLGLHGEAVSFEGSPPENISFYCSSLADSQLGAVPGNVTTGNSAQFMPATLGRVPLSAVIEPDADNDGFGDETQDGCPQSALSQGTCPLVVIGALSRAARSAATVLVTTDSVAPVSLVGTVALGKGKKATLKAPAQTATSGQLLRFKLKFNAKLKKRLQELPPSKKLTLKVTVSATNVSGQVSTTLVKSKLKGQA